MKSQRLFTWFAWVLLLVALSAGSVLAQDQSYPPPDNNYPDANADVQTNGPIADSSNGNVPQSGVPDSSNGNLPQNGNLPPGDNPQDRQDPPGRVARVQYMSGQVSMQPGGVNDWIAANMNRPLTTADRVWTDKNSRAELNVGDGFLRMNSETSVTLTNVGDSTVQVELDQGVLSLTVKHLERGEVYEIDTPNFAFTVMKPGTYRFDVYPNEDQSWVTVRSGYGEATGKGNAVRVNSGQQMRFSGGNSLQHTAEGAPARDGFDDWARVRDQRLDSSLSARYVSPGVIGYQDLDNYGTWQNTPDYGSVWVPSGVPVGWAPYRYGHWAWIAPWGWTWVDDAPWGFAPFHYGRWVSWNGGWGWAPGPLGYWNPYYAPALVGWIGGPGFGIGFGFGGGGWGFGIGINFGWFPLGWGAPYYPRYCGWGHGGWYRGGGYVSNGYLRNVNITNTRINNFGNITNNYYSNKINGNYGNRSIPGAVTAAPQSAFTSGAAINKVGVAVPKADLGKGQILHTASVTPTQASVLGGQAARTTAVPPASATRGNVVTHANPPAGPASVQAANQATMARNGGASAGNRTAGGAPAGVTATNHNTAMPSPAGNRGSTATGSATNNVSRPPSAGGASNVSTARNTAPGSSAAGNPSARNATPGNNTAASNGAGHYVPRPPNAGGTEIARNTGALASPATHTVPRPPSSNDTFARGTANSMNSRPVPSTTNSAGANTHTTATSSSPYRGSNSTSSVPRPPQSYQPGHTGSTAPAQSSPSYRAPSSSTPSHSSSPSYQGSTAPRGSGLNSVPRPPSTYTYRPAPSYSASANYGAARANSSYGAGRSSSPSASSGYGASRSTYPSGSPYGAGRSSSPSASGAYGGRNPYGGGSPYGGGRSNAPSYSAHSSPQYSAPRSLGGYGGGSRSSGGGSHAPSGGGGSHGGGGGHSSGGGGHHG